MEPVFADPYKAIPSIVGILHGCLATGTLYDEATAWSHHAESLAA
jgi:poly(3-hydroxybutyrate) depolymerase